jgi:hypothetical protein
MKLITLKHRALAALAIAFSFAFSCHDENQNPEGSESCALGNTPGWVSEVTTAIEEAGYQGEVIRYRYKRQFVYLVNGCTHCADYITFVYNCDKTELCKFGGFAGYNTCPDFYEQATDPVVIWKN